MALGDTKGSLKRGFGVLVYTSVLIVTAKRNLETVLETVHMND